MSALGVIAGTGFYALDALDSPRQVEVTTSYGPARAVVGGLHGRETVFLARHGADHSVPPHRVNYLANIAALVDLGVTEVLAVNVVGGIAWVAICTLAGLRYWASISLTRRRRASASWPTPAAYNVPVLTLCRS